MTNWYVYNAKGEKVGPVSSSTLKEWARQKRIAPETIVETEDGRRAPAGKIKGMEFPDDAPVILSAPPTVSTAQPAAQPTVQPTAFQPVSPVPVPLQPANVSQSPQSVPAPASNPQSAETPESELFGMKPNTYFMLMHLSLFVFAPISFIILWVIAKDKDSRVSIHGKNILNAIISYSIYYLLFRGFAYVVTIILLPDCMEVDNTEDLLLDGTFLKALGLTVILFNIFIIWMMFFVVSTIMAAICAKKGQFMPYPLAIRFFKTDVHAMQSPKVEKANTTPGLLCGIVSLLSAGGMLIVPIIGMARSLWSLKTKTGTRRKMALVFNSLGIVFGIVFCCLIISIFPSVEPSTPDSTSSPPSSTRTLEKYNRIQIGMSYDEVVAIVGSPTAELADSEIQGISNKHVSIPGIRTTVYMWQVDDSLGANFNITFQNGKVVVKAQFGLK